MEPSKEPPDFQPEVYDIPPEGAPAQEPEQPQEKEPEAKAVMATIELDERGLVKAKDNAELLRFCKGLVLSGMVPQRFKKPQELFGALMFVRALGLPDIAIRQVANIKGTPSIFGDLPLALAQNSKHFVSIREYWFDEAFDIISFTNKNLKNPVFGAVCFIKRRGGQEEEHSFTLDDARQAGLYPAKEDATWTKYTKMMLRYRARSIAVKSQFADCISGVSIGEYDFNEHDIRDVSESKVADSANEIFGNKASEGADNDINTTSEPVLGSAESEERREA